MEFQKPWWFSVVPTMLTLVVGYQIYLQQRSLFRFEDAQMMATKLMYFGAQSPNRFSDLNDSVADTFGITSGYQGGLDRSKFHFAPAELNGTPGFAYTITVDGLNKGDCKDLEPNVLFSSVQVNGQRIDHSTMSVSDIQGLCHSTIWPWTAKNVVVLTGS